MSSDPTSVGAGSRLYHWQSGPFPASRIHRQRDDDPTRTACGKVVTRGIRLEPEVSLLCRKCHPWDHEASAVLPHLKSTASTEEHARRQYQICPSINGTVGLIISDMEANNSPPPEHEVVTVAEAARRLDVHTKTIERWLKKGDVEIHHRDATRRRYIDLVTVDPILSQRAWVQRGTSRGRALQQPPLQPWEEGYESAKLRDDSAEVERLREEIRVLSADVERGLRENARLQRVQDALLDGLEARRDS